MSWQRRHWQRAQISRVRKVQDSRGNWHQEPDLDDFVEIWAALIPQRSARAELHGQGEINIYKVTTRAPLVEEDGFNMYSRFRWDGREWDVVTPIRYVHAPGRRLRHYVFDIRKRPS